MIRQIKNLFDKASLVQVMGFSFTIVVVLIITVATMIKINAGHTYNEVERLQEIGLQAVKTADKMAFDVVQVQQFVTDGSLTRNPESIQQADSAHNDFNIKTTDLARLLVEGFALLGMDKPTAETKMLSNMNQEVNHLFSVGKQMMQAYQRSRSEGDKMMAKFDAASAKIAQGPTSAIAQLQQRTSIDLHQKMDSIEQMIVGEAVAATVFLLLLFLLLRNALFSRLMPAINTLRSWETDAMEARITHIRTSGLTGELSWSLNNFGDRMEAFMRDLTASLTAMASGVDDRRMDPRGFSPEMRRSVEIVNHALDGMAHANQAATTDRCRTQQFEQQVNAMVSQLAEVGDRMRTRAKAVAEFAQGSSSRASAVTSDASRASGNVETVAAAAEELSASIGEVSRQVAAASSVVEMATSKGASAVQQIDRLGQASRDISGMIEVINNIAAQTNLLALNASIEAARAGDAGRGFAVVAGEVKDLAGQTARATDEIAPLIANIQNESDEAVIAIKEIADIIDDFSTTFEQINLAASEQSTAANEISHSVQEASQSVSEVLGNIEMMATAATETGIASDDMVGEASSVMHATDKITVEVANFLGDLSYNQQHAPTVQKMKPAHTAAIETVAVVLNEQSGVDNDPTASKGVGRSSAQRSGQRDRTPPHRKISFNPSNILPMPVPAAA